MGNEEKKVWAIIKVNDVAIGKMSEEQVKNMNKDLEFAEWNQYLQKQAMQMYGIKEEDLNTPSEPAAKSTLKNLVGAVENLIRATKVRNEFHKTSWRTFDYEESTFARRMRMASFMMDTEPVEPPTITEDIDCEIVPLEQKLLKNE